MITQYIQILATQTLFNFLKMFREYHAFSGMGEVSIAVHYLCVIPMSTPSQCGQGFNMWTLCVIKTPRAKAGALCGRIPIMPRHFQPPSLDTIHSDDGEEFAGLDDIMGTTSSDDDIDKATAGVEIPAVGEHPTYEDYEDVSYS
jgi:hypothetical protein